MHRWHAKFKRLPYDCSDVREKADIDIIHIEWKPQNSMATIVFNEDYRDEFSAICPRGTVIEVLLSYLLVLDDRSNVTSDNQ